MTQFYGKTKVCCGRNALDALERLSAGKAVLVTDPFMATSGFADRIKSRLDRAGMGCTVFDRVEPEPSLETVIAGVRLLLAEGADLVVALGGGSAIDAAKAMAFFAHKAGGTRPLLAAVPTTAGTGSEVTAFSVITDKAHGLKIPLNDEALIPDVAFLDARFTRTLPPHVTAATGLDVLTHAIEAYTSLQANAFTDIHAEKAIRYVFRYLPRAFACADDMEARERMLLGSCMAGMAFNNSGLGLTHGIAHSLGALFHIPHGLANSVLLPHVIRFNGFDAGVKYREIAAMLSLQASGVEEAVTYLIEAVRGLSASLGLADRISGLKVEEGAFRARLDQMAGNALEDFCTTGNPCRPSKSDIRAILERAW